MPSPFPGMDPFIESQEWEDFHARAIIVISELVSDVLPPGFAARAERRVYFETDSPYGNAKRRVIVPDDSVVADPTAVQPLSEVVRASDDGRILLAIGPEGGWNAFELDLLGAHGFRSAGMGPRTLRTDTACVALLALAHAGISDFRIQISD